MSFFLWKKKNQKKNTLSVRYGTDLDIDVLRQVYELDVLVYDEKLCGVFENLVRRHEFNRDSFICAMDGSRLAGYINFFPVGEALHAELLDPEKTRIRDDDIEPNEMAQYSTDKANNIFIISVAVHPDYRNGEAVKLIGNSFAQFIADKHNAGYIIEDISGAAVSDGGRRFLSRLHMEPRKKLDDGYELYVCDGVNIKELIENGVKVKK